MKTIYHVFATTALLACLLSCSGSKRATTYHAYVTGKMTELTDHHTFHITHYSDDPDYGYTQKKPILVGGAENLEGPLNERRFLNALAGPNGEKLYYTRLGSCCNFRTPRGFSGGGLLDIYEITWEGQETPVTLYLNMYDYGLLKVPVGFTLNK